MTRQGLDYPISVSTTIQHTVRDLVEATALLVNAHIIDVAEARRLVDVIEGTFPGCRRKSHVELAREGIEQMRGSDDRPMDEWKDAWK